MDEAIEAYKRGEIILGGCCIELDENGNSLMPDWQCKECEAQFIAEQSTNVLLLGIENDTCVMAGKSKE